MQVQRAVQLGMLHKQLGIEESSCVRFQYTQTGVVIWDFTSGAQYTVELNGPSASLAKDTFQVPQRVKEILAATDTDLKKWWEGGEGWTDERETIFTELCARGVNMLPGQV
jgi:hypothetical protein